MTYGSRANAAAATATHCGGEGCPSCVKSGLPVLLVRPGLADPKYASDRAARIKPLLKGVADPGISASGYVMRTLRQGYLYAYYEKPHTPEIQNQKGWQAFHVDAGGYLTPVPLAAVEQAPKTFSCKRQASYAIAMLFVIPEAKSAGKVWVGFSDHPWSNKVRARYAADAALRGKRMACIDATAGKADRAVPMSVLNIEDCVADYKPNLAKTWPEALKGNPFQGHQLTGQTDAELRAAQAGKAKGGKAAACLLDDDPPQRRREWASDVMQEARKIVKAVPGGGYSEANLMIVSVPDPVGVTTEAAQRRMTLCRSAVDWLSQQQPAYRLQSALQIEGMLQIIEQNGANRKAYQAKFASQNGAKISRSQFDAMVKSGRLPPDATFNPGVKYSSARYQVLDHENGTIGISSAKQIDYETADLKDEVIGKLQAGKRGPKYKEFLDTFRAKIDADQKSLQRFQKDYEAWMGSDARKLITRYDFDTANQKDGLPYAECVAKLTLGGPMTESGRELFKPFLSAHAGNDEALLTRALLGNQRAFFTWLTELDQTSKTYDAIKTLLDLDPVKQALQQAGSSTVATRARDAVEQLLTVSGAVAAAMDKVGNLPERLRYQLKLLTMAVMVRSETLPLTLVRISTTLSEASRLWHEMLGQLRDVAAKTERKVESLLLNAAVAVEMNGATKAANRMIDVYLLIQGTPEAVFGKLKTVGAVAGRYIVQPAEVYGVRMAGLTARIGLPAASQMARQSFDVMKTGNGVLAAGAGLLQMLLVGKAWNDYAAGSEQERQAAALSLMSAGIGVAAAWMEWRSVAARQAGQRLREEGLKKTAGRLAAVATAIDAMQAAINAGRAYQDGDRKALAAHFMQILFFAGAVGAGIAAAGGGSAFFLGISATGWGLILVGIGVLIGFIVLLIKDKPPEKWAAKTIWGIAPSKWGSLAEEAEEANKVLLGVEIEYSYRMNLLQNMGNSAAAAHGGAFAALLTDAEPQPYTREAWLRLNMPTALAKKLPWEMRIFAKDSAGDHTIGAIRHYGGGDLAKLSDFKLPAIIDHRHEVSEKDNVSSHVLRITVDGMKIRAAWAKVRIFSESRTEDGDDIIIVDEELRD